VENDERYISEDDLPQVMTWFPMQKNYIGPAQTNETAEEKTGRLIKLTKHVRTQLHRITSGLDAIGEERLLEYLEIRESIGELETLLTQCNDSNNSESLEKASSGVREVKNTIRGVDFDQLVEEIFVHNQFRVGVEKILKPWISELEKEAFKSKDKPLSFDDARELEKKAVTFAKEVRKANKLITRLEAEAEKQSNKLFSRQLVEDLMTQFRHVAQSAANGVEQTRNVILKWGFFLEMKKESDDLYDNVVRLFPDVKPELISLGEDEYDTGLPMVLTNFISMLGAVSTQEFKPESLESASKIKTDLQSLAEQQKKGAKILEKISECTEKTPSHQTVWNQTGQLKKSSSVLQIKLDKLTALEASWRILHKSMVEDSLEFQPLLSFMQTYQRTLGN